MSVSEFDVRPPPWLKLQRLVGVGGMGKVFAGTDSRSGERVAVKTLSHFGGRELLCLKNEFRSFAGVVHPNLISQHELVENEGQWFLLMELLEGVELMYFVRGQAAPTIDDVAVTPRNASDSTRTSSKGAGNLDAPLGTSAPAPSGPRRAISADDLTRIIPVLRQLALGIEAIHRSGYFHRDIKPSNVFVTPEGRTVLLDFGIAIAKQTARADLRAGDVVVGTPAYIAPEIHAGKAASAASDWYSFGVVLYEALTGGKPFDSGMTLRTRLESTATPVSQLAPHVNSPLCALADRLLDIEPARRPTFGEIIALLGGSDDDATSNQRVDHALIGRSEERKRLHAAALEARTKPTSLFVSGRSGVGKSVLLSAFLGELEAAGSLVLSGRCYEQEVVPYKTIDKLVDALTSELQNRPEWLAALQSIDVGALTRGFPVLRDVFSAGAVIQSTNDNTIELQRRAIAALTEVLQFIAGKVPLVLCVDDLQWGDVVGAQVLARMAAPSGPPVFVIGSFRAEDANSPVMTSLSRLFTQEIFKPIDVLTVGPLSAPESAELAAAMAAETGIRDPELIRWALSEAEGQPIFLHELLYAAAHDPEIAKRSVGHGLQDIVAARVDHLPDEMRHLFEVVCIAGSVVPQEVATHAARVQHAARSYHQLRALHFIRTTRRDREDFVDTFHDKFREIITSKIEPNHSRQIHAQLVYAWLRTPNERAGRSFALANHARAAGNLITDEISFAVHRDAALSAFAAFDSARARELLQTAKTIAVRMGHTFEPQLECMLGNACFGVDDVDGAKAAFDSALANSRDPVVRANAHVGRSRIFMSSINSRGGFTEASLALEVLGLPAVANSRTSLARTAFAWLAMYLRHRLFGLEAQRPTDEIAARLYSMSGYAASFLFSPKLMVGSALRGLIHVSRLPPTRAVAEASVYASVIFSVAGLRKLSQRLTDTARAVASASNDPGAVSLVDGFAALAVDFGGDPINGQRLGTQAVAPGSRLDGSAFLTVIGSIAWSMLMRGQAQPAAELLHRGFARMGQRVMTQGHLWDAISALASAFLGQPEVGGPKLVQYLEFLRRNAPDDRYLHITVIGYQALFLHLTGAPDEDVERCVRTHEGYGFAPAVHMRSVRHIYLAKAARQGDQVVANPPKANVVAEAKRTITELRTFDKDPTVKLHRELLETKVRWAEGAEPLTALRGIRARAEALEAPWLAFEAVLAEALWFQRQGQHDKVKALQPQLEALTAANGLIGLLTRARKVLSAIS